MSSNDIFGDVVAYDIDLLLKVIDSIRDHLDWLNFIISQMVNIRSNITTAPIIISHISAFD